MTTMSIEEIKEHLECEFYLIETDSDGKRYMHVEEFLWDAHNGDRTIYDEETDEEIPADVVVTEYTGCYIPLEELIAAEDRWDLINDYEAECQQYEGEYTFKQFQEMFEPSELGCLIDAGTCFSASYLDYKDITMDTPDGWYYYNI